jgi:glycerol-1-phosphate dehydrogenase [NAD(P)+]
MRMEQSGHEFTTIFGRNLVGELQNFVHTPYMVVTMEDLWPKFENLLPRAARVYLVHTLDVEELSREAERLPNVNCIIGLGGGQAIDVAKFFAWTKRLPLFQVPTAMTVNAPFGHRAGLRAQGKVRYMGWAVPEAVYVDFDVIQSAPPLLNRSGICEILCYHTAHYDWKLADNLGKTEPQWPYDQRLVDQARVRLDRVIGCLDEIRDVTEEGIRTLMLANRWGGATFHNAGWNPRHIEGIDHFFFYTLEFLTGKHFIHGQPVCLGIYIGSLLQENRADEMLAAIHRAGVDIRPEAMGVSWDDAAEAMRKLAWYVRYAGLWYTIADVKPVTEEFIETVRERVYSTFGVWNGMADSVAH